MNAKILLVDDDPDILQFLTYNMQKEGYQVVTADNGIDALKKLKNFTPDLIILDVMMPEMDGIKTCHEIRKNPDYDNVIISFLSARGEDYSQIAGFEAGADDYITKPINPKVLISKLKSLLRRVNSNKILRLCDEFVIDIDQHFVFIKDKEIFLPRKEFNILSLLATEKDKVLTRDIIHKKVWGENIFVSDRTIDVHIRKIRQKIGEQYIQTVKGVGYKFVCNKRTD